MEPRQSQEAVRFSCPRCGRRFTRSIEEIVKDARVFCPHCGELHSHKKLEELKQRLRREILEHELRFRRRGGS